MRFDDQRKKMVDNQLKARGITDEKVINAFLKVPREVFVSDVWKDFSYNDSPLSIGYKQTISQPYIVAFMMSLLELKETDRVLEIGTGCGYQTALLAEIASEVYTIDRIEELVVSAKQTLKGLEYKNVYFKIGDGCLGWINAMPFTKDFDKIIISAGSPNVPEVLVSQLKNGGKIVMPQGSITQQDIMVYEKKDDELVSENHGKCVFVPLIGEGAWNEG